MYKKTARVAGRFLLQWVERWLSELSAWLGTGLVLWPWLVADVMFVLFLGVSTQGQAQADSLFKRPEQTGWLFGSLAVSILLTLTACLFTSLVAAYRRRAVETVSRADNAGGESGFAWGGAARRYLVWSFLLAATPGLALAWASKEPSVAVSVLVVCAASAWAVFWLLEHRGGTAADWLDRLDELHRMRVLLATVVTALAAGSLWLGSTLSIRYPDALYRIGAPAIELVGLAAVASLFGAVFAAWPRCWRWPRLGRLLVGALVVYNLSGQPLADPQNPLLREERLLAQADIQRKEADNKCHHASADLGLDSRALEAGDAPAVVQDFVVGAEGGGIRATYWTAIGLGLTDMAVAEDFGAKLRLMSGVSGGSLGIATWLAARETPSLDAQARLNLISDFLATDFLASSVAGLVFLDSPRLFFGGLWPSTRRDDLFEAAFVKRWLAMGGSNFFLRRLNELCFTVLKRPPQVFFNATEALAGVPASIGNTSTNLPGGNHHLLTLALADSSLKFATVSQVAVMSARFPFLSPAADIGIQHEMLRWHMEFVAGVNGNLREIAAGGGPRTSLAPTPFSREDHEKTKPKASPCEKGSGCVRLGVLVDGGYFDNSGLQLVRTKLLDVMDPPPADIKKVPRADVRPPIGAGLLRVGALQFVNSPAEMCTLDPRWADRLPAFLSRLFAEVGFTPLCDFEIDELRATRTPRSWQWLTSPAEALLAVREGHALTEQRSMVALIRNRMHNSSYRSLSLSNAASAQDCYARANGPKNSIFLKYGIKQPELAASTPVVSYAPGTDPVDKQVAELKPLAQAEVREAIRKNQVEQRICSAQRKHPESAGSALLTGKPAAMVRERTRLLSVLRPELSKCEQYPPAPYAPLGWSLRPVEIESMRCLAASAALHALLPGAAADVAKRAKDRPVRGAEGGTQPSPTSARTP